MVDLDPDGQPVGRCVILPGRGYSPDGPLLFFAAQVALARGWQVRQVWWSAPARDAEVDEQAWVGDQLDAALVGHAGPALVVGKSLGTWGAARAAALGLDAAWLTPLLTDAAATAPLRSYPARQLVVIGEQDPFLDPEVLATLPGSCLVVPGDHVLRVVGDPVASVLHHAEVARAFDTWLAEGSC